VLKRERKGWPNLFFLIPKINSYIRLQILSVSFTGEFFAKFRPEKYGSYLYKGFFCGKKKKKRLKFARFQNFKISNCQITLMITS
jgi:hypothetical protein